jgi:hypothetical protein
MVYLNGFAVTILPARDYEREFTRDGAWYLALNNGEEFSLELTNNRDVPVDVDVEIDGTDVGSWRIDPYSTITLERPADTARKFTFLSELSSEALDAGAIPGNINNGLVRVTFKPKKRVVYQRLQSPRRLVGRSTSSVRSQMASIDSIVPSSSLVQSISGPRYESGVTLLGDESYQRFSEVRPLRPDEIDYSNITTIEIRLVVKRRPRYLPLSPRNGRRTPYPPRIDSRF